MKRLLCWLMLAGILGGQTMAQNRSSQNFLNKKANKSPQQKNTVPPTDPFSFKAPPNWKSERIPFPLDFAPEISLKGFEELRFAPGMFDRKAETYFTYAFFWWIEGNPRITAPVLEKDLMLYFQGLCREVGKPRGLSLDVTKIRSKIEAKPLKGKSASFTQQFVGTIEAFDPFNGGNPLQLNVEISVKPCPGAAHTCVFFGVSPQSVDLEVWKQLREIRDSFQCESGK